VDYFGWVQFFVLCFVLAIPGMLLLLKVAPWNAMSSLRLNENV
jgi:PAT family beta-lactamase induction signal transducer AmpG